MLRLAIIFESALLALAFVLGYALDVPFWNDATGSLGDLFYGAALSIPLFIAVVALTELEWKVLGQMHDDLKKVTALLRDCRPLDLLLIALLAGICEEALFRGFLQQYLMQFTSPATAIVISSFMFGLCHALSPTYLLFATGISIYLGWIFLAFDGLAAPVALHAAYDFVALLYAIHLRPKQRRPCR